MNPQCLVGQTRESNMYERVFADVRQSSPVMMSIENLNPYVSNSTGRLNCYIRYRGRNYLWLARSPTLKQKDDESDRSQARAQKYPHRT